MASYQSTFSPPTRPETGVRARKLAAYIPPSSSGTKTETPGRIGHRDASIGQVSAEMDLMRSKSHGRPTNLPRRSGRSPLPTPTTEVKGKSMPGFGFRRPTAIPSAAMETQTLKNKHSRNILRRKPSSITQNVTCQKPNSLEVGSAISPGNKRSTASSLLLDKISDEHNRQPTIPDVENPAPIIPELDRYRSVRDPKGHMHNRFGADILHKLATQDLPPPTPLSSGVSGHNRYSGYSGYSGYSASPSTRYSESPGPGAYSRDTTPTSVSSQSPGVIAPVRVTPRLRQNSPNTSRPPVTRRRTGSVPNEVEPGTIAAQGLPSLRESLTSSSSNSTVLGTEKGSQSTKEKKKKNRLSPLPPSPPPRKSSQKFKKSRSIEGEELASPPKAHQTPTRTIKDAATIEPSLMKSPGIASPQSASKGTAPLRPSRDGTPDLRVKEPVMVIHSNLAGIHFSGDRRKSGSLPMLHREVSPAPSGLGIVPDLRPTINQGQQRQQPSALRTPSPGAAAPKHRFGFFGRRPKTAREPASEQKERPTRKGPAAGTGHEGYGRYALRGRSVSSIGRDRSGSVASSSQESINSNRTHDPFFLERMSPVIIAGGGEIVENHNVSLELSRTDSGQSLQSVNPDLDSRLRGPRLPSSPARTTLWPSAMPRDSVANRSLTSIASKGSYPSSGSDNDFVKKPTLAFRRSMHRLRLGDQEPSTLPKPIKIVADSSPPATSSRDTSFTPDNARHEANRSAIPQEEVQLKKLSKRPRSPRKWNFFQRSRTAAKSKTQPEAILPVVVSRTQMPSRPVPYYAMMDSSEQEGDDSMDIEDILRDADVVDLSKAENLMAPNDGHIDNQRRLEGGLDLAPNMPSPDGGSTKSQVHDAKAVKLLKVDIRPSGISNKCAENLRPQGDADEFSSKPQSAENGRSGIQVPARPSRLPQVGRIPRVVSARPLQTSPKSFSRPFARISISQPLPNLGVVDRESIALGPSPERSPSTQEQAPEPREDLSPTDAIHSRIDQNAFFAMPPRKDSEATTSSSSGTMSYAGTTAIIPKPDAALEEDEVWDEYDDLIWNEPLVDLGLTSSSQKPFLQYERFRSQLTVESNEEHTEYSLAATYPLGRNGATVPPRLELTSSSVYSMDLSADIKNSIGGLAAPASPSSFTDLFASYGDRNNSMIAKSEADRNFSPHSYRDSGSLSAHSKRESLGEKLQLATDSRLVNTPKQTTESSMAQVNLRVGSMTVSKWLTFGHVLFSPAREEILSSKESKYHSILVIDGLGNDDWSFYAAETYPSATFYNLSSTPSITDASSTRTAPFPQAPTNHRQVQYQSNLDKFPFPRDTFAAIVMRFPAICSDASIRNLISESKRVLKPAGYLEMSILDLDMMNMGNRTRRAVRGLKVKLTVAEPSASLASASDTVLRAVGKRGFEDIKSCNVGVPVASAVTSGNSPKLSPSEERDISLADMMKDESDAGDVGITKMVARVGRWWFIRCYEMAVLPDGDTSKSIFEDTTLLKECEKWNTSFKLLVCHAQKPVVPHRKTASV